MKYISSLFSLFLILSLLSCQTDIDSKKSIPSTFSSTQDTWVSISPAFIAGMEHENLRIHPINIKLEANLSDKYKGVKTLKEGIKTPGFYITEKKTYGRDGQRGAVSTLTVQNKSQDTIFLMQGDIVQGGNQDRILAEDKIILPRTILDIPVFCVEKGRWNYEEPIEKESKEAEKKRKMFAFSGYYNVASNSLRQTVQKTNDQNSVWSKVNEITTKQSATSSTATYTALANSEKFNALQNDYLSHYKGILNNNEATIGIIAVSGGKILGVDVFQNHQLFERKFESLLHAYVIDAINDGNKPSISSEQFSTLAKYYEQQITAALKKKSHKKAYHFQEDMIHFVDIK